MKTTDQPRIFISYSHGGNGPAWKASLLRALHVFELHHLLDVWEDGKIRVSAYWDDDITQAMTSAQLAVVLLTPEALKSMYVIEREFPILSSRQTHDKLPIIPVICEPCDWKAHDWIRATQAPNASNPLSELTPTQIDRVFRTIATEIAETLSHVALAGLSSADAALQQTRVYLDRFPLTRGAGLHHERLIGREQELALLDLAFAQPHTAVVSLVAWGGVGKSMLVKHWLRRLEHENWFAAQSVYAWNFYSQGAKEDRQGSEDFFLAHALEWFGVECEPKIPPCEKGRLLADAFSRERTVLILDGIEPLQYPPGPMGGQLRAPGVQSLLQQFVRNSSRSEHDGLCLVTTREPLTDLADFQRREGSPWGSVLRVDLSNLTDEAGAALLHHTGAKRAGAAEINPDDMELLAASRNVNGHALTLNLLGRFLARAHGGDIRRRDLVKFEEADRKEQGGTTFKMLAAFENWFAKSGEFGARQLAVLRMLGLFDRPADSSCIAALRQPPVIAGLTDPIFTARLDASHGQATMQPLFEEDWNTATSFLSDFTLVLIQNNAEENQFTLDCHPLIREHFAKHLRDTKPEVWRTAHRRLYKHLCAATKEGDQPTLAALQPLYQAVAHGCQAGLNEDAFDKTFWARINRETTCYSENKLGALGSNLGAIGCFFEQRWSKVSSLLTETSKAWVLNSAGYTLRALGRLSEAVEPIQLGLEMRIQEENWAGAARVASNLSELTLLLGAVASAVEEAKKSFSYAERSGGGAEFMGACITYADALHQAGHWKGAERCFSETEDIQAQFTPFPMLLDVAGYRYCDLLLSAPERAAWHRLCSSKPKSDSASFPLLTHIARFFKAASPSHAAEASSCLLVTQRAARTLNWKERIPGAPVRDIALDHLTLGRAALYTAILGKAEPYLTDDGFETAHRELDTAVAGLRRAGQQQFLPVGLLTRACLRSVTGAHTGSESAQADLDEAWYIAERGPMRLHQADIHLHRARLYFRETSYPWKSAQNDLAAAENLINDCGYHRRDDELADAKRAILGTVS